MALGAPTRTWRVVTSRPGSRRGCFITLRSSASPSVPVCRLSLFSSPISMHLRKCLQIQHQILFYSCHRFFFLQITRINELIYLFLFLFLFFRKLRVSRMSLHRNLLIAILLHNSLTIVIKTEIFFDAAQHNTDPDNQVSGVITDH